MHIHVLSAGGIHHLLLFSLTAARHKQTHHMKLKDHIAVSRLYTELVGNTPRKNYSTLWVIIAILLLLFLAADSRGQRTTLDIGVGMSSREFMPVLTADLGVNLLESKLGERVRVEATATAEATFGYSAGAFVGYQGYGVMFFTGAAVHRPLNNGKMPMVTTPQMLVGLKIYEADHRGRSMISFRWMGNPAKNLHAFYLTMGFRLGDANRN